MKAYPDKIKAVKGDEGEITGFIQLAESFRKVKGSSMGNPESRSRTGSANSQ